MNIIQLLLLKIIILMFFNKYKEKRAIKWKEILENLGSV